MTVPRDDPGGDRVPDAGDDAHGDAHDDAQPGAGPAPLVRAAPDAGGAVVAVDLVVTAVFVVTSVLATAVPGLRGPAVVVDALLFLAGGTLMLVALARAAARSRTEEIAVSNLFFLAGSAPRRPQVRLLGCLAVQVVVAAATAGARPYTSLAFGVLAPLWGLGLTGVWAARYGSFPPTRRGTAGSPG